MPRALLVGIEGDVQLSRQRGDVTLVCPGDACNPLLAPLDAPAIASFDHRLPWFGTLRGRIGTPVTPHLLPYVTAGVAFGEVKTSGTLAGFDAIGNAVNADFSHTTFRGGWTVGGGLEAHLGGNWTAKAEYLYMDFGFFSIAPASPVDATVAATINPRLTSNIVRAGINYKLY
jgi:iron complex outermembrane receptor protein